jgi:Glutamate synthase central domain
VEASCGSDPYTLDYVKELNRICAEAAEAIVERDCQFIVLSDRMGGPDRIPLSALLVLGAVHHHLIEERLRMKVPQFSSVLPHFGFGSFLEFGTNRWR